MGRFKFYPHISLPFGGGGGAWFPQAAFRDTLYTITDKRHVHTLHHPARGYVPNATGMLNIARAHRSGNWRSHGEWHSGASGIRGSYAGAPSAAR